MGSVDVYYLSQHHGSPIVVDSSGGVDQLFDRLRSESPVTAPILANIFVSDDVRSQDLEAGVNGDRGVVRYSGREWPAGVLTTNGRPDDDELWYFYAGHVREFPASAEVDLHLVREAVKEFMETGGARPTCVQWQPDTMLD